MKKILLCLLALVLSFFALTAAQAKSPEMTLLAINVGKADALLLRSGKSVYLIDTGTKQSADALLDALRREGVKRLTGVILTHTHSDHAGGLRSLLESEIAVDKIYASKYYVKEKADAKHPVEKATKKTGAAYETIFLSTGDTLPLDGGELSVVGPLEESETENNNSLVLLAKGGGGSILLTGDMEFPEEESLLAAGLLPRATVLKIGNHGESDATGKELLDAVQPELAVISTNSVEEPDTPSRRVVKLLNSRNIPYLVTENAELGVLVTLRGGELLTEIK